VNTVSLYFPRHWPSWIGDRRGGLLASYNSTLKQNILENLVGNLVGNFVFLNTFDISLHLRINLEHYTR